MGNLFLDCCLNGPEVEVLWDTGAQFSIMPKQILKPFPECTVKEIKSLLDEGLNIQLLAANATRIRYIGWVDLEFKLLDDSQKEVEVPFPFTERHLSTPIIGYNVIEQVVQTQHPAFSHVPQLGMMKSVPSMSSTEAEALVNFITSTDSTRELCAIGE